MSGLTRLDPSLCTLPGPDRSISARPPGLAIGVEPPYRFVPQVAVVGRVAGQTPIAQLEAEQGVYSASADFVRAHCGEVANAILDSVPGWYFDEAADLGLHPNIDVRIHRLYPGDLPAYPGWHCDGEYRETYFSQPDLQRIPVSRHIIATVSSPGEEVGGVSNTRFLADPFSFSPGVPPDSDHTLWGQVDAALANEPELSYWDSEDGEIICFDARTLHRVQPANRRGWRLFFRLAMWHRPNLGAGGMLTRQEQVYKQVLGSGW